MRNVMSEASYQAEARDKRRRGGRLDTSCSVRGCPVQTSERKPFCIEHITRMAYPAALREVDDARRADLAAGAEGRPPSLDGVLVGDAVRHLATAGAARPCSVVKAVAPEIASGSATGRFPPGAAERAAGALAAVLESARLAEARTVRQEKRGGTAVVLALTRRGRAYARRLARAG